MLDMVHDIQMVYRKIVDATARPGIIGNIENQAERINYNIGCSKSIMVLMLMLLDTEVTFKVISKNETEIAKQLNQLTYAKSASTEKADFIIVLSDSKPSDFEEALIKANVGDLVNPHKSATIVVEVDEISYGKGIILKGPGIEKEHYIKIKNDSEWITIRENKIFEYPLGIEIIFVDSKHNVVCIPRTTQIKKQVVR